MWDWLSFLAMWILIYLPVRVFESILIKWLVKGLEYLAINVIGKWVKNLRVILPNIKEEKLWEKLGEGLLKKLLAILSSIKDRFGIDVQYTRKTTRHGDEETHFNFSVGYGKEKGTEEDESKAVCDTRETAEQEGSIAQLQRKAKQKDATAQYDLGLAYYMGSGVEEDNRKAMHWYRKAAEQSHAEALFNLGVMYEYGEGGTKDYSNALYCYYKAAEQGVVRALAHLALMYSQGRGVDEDKHEAVRLYLLAAEQGDTEAQFRLAGAYVLGEGIEQNFRESCIWLLIAKESGHKKADEALQKNPWYHKLPPEDIESIKQDADKRIKEIQERIKTKG